MAVPGGKAAATQRRRRENDLSSDPPRRVAHPGSIRSNSLARDVRD